MLPAGVYYIFVVVFTLPLLHITTGTIYHIVPDDDHHVHPINNNSFTLQHYLSNISKYCHSHNVIEFLPGNYVLTGDILVENIMNFSLTGNRANGIITTVITCAASHGVVIVNSSDIIVKDIIISECYLPDSYSESMKKASLLLQNSWHVSILNVQLLCGLTDDLSPCALQASNVFGDFVLDSIKVNCLDIYYDAVYADNTITSKNKLCINNYQPDFLGTSIYFISINADYALYDIEIVISNTVFTKFPAFNFQCYGFQGYSFIKIKDCIFTEISNFYGSSLININMKNCINKYETGSLNLIILSNCTLTKSVLKPEEALVNVTIKADSNIPRSFINKLRVIIKNCKFYNNKNGALISVIYSKSGVMGYTHYVYVVCEYTKFGSIILHNNSYAIYTQRAVLTLMSVTFNHVHCDDASAIIKTVNGALWFRTFVKMLSCTAAEAAIIAKCMFIGEFTVVIFTANNFAILTYSEEYYGTDPAQTLTPMMLLPCIFQYADVKNLDERFNSGDELNYSIIFISNNIESLSFYKYSITYCGWTGPAGFTHTRPKIVNQNVIHYINDSLEYDKIVKDICFCDKKYQEPGLPGFNCTLDKLGPFYPGQTIELHFITIIVPLYMETLLIRIEDGPESACSTKNRSVITLLRFNVCTKITYTVQHKSGKECDLYIKGVPKYNGGYSASPTQAMTEFFNVQLLPCPIGFTLLKSDGLCQCDPVLLMHIASVKICNIDDQTILRQPNSWITGTTINDSHAYNVSLSCPFDYCSPYSSHLNLLNPDSQSQFNRTGTLCGQCQQDLSAVLGSSQCKKCSNVYLLLIIPIAITGIALVMVLFTFNLTVTDGDVNALLFYVDIVSINSSALFSRDGFIHYTSISLANLDLGIETCFYNGMDDYAKTWLQFLFPGYLIMIAVALIVGSRYSIRVQRLTARKALPVLATIFLLSYTKVLRTISSVLFFYYEIISLPSKRTTLVWSVDTSAPLFGTKFLLIFVVSLCFFLILLFFNVILIFTRILSYFKLINRYKPLLDAYQGPYKDKYYFWTGFQLVMRAVFFGLSGLDRNTNLMISSMLIGTVACLHGTLFPFKNKAKNVQEILMMLNLNCVFVYSLYTSSNDIAVTIFISLAFFQFSLIVINHIRLYLLSFHSVCLAKDKLDTAFKKCFAYFKRPVPINNNNINRGNLQLIPEVAYNFREFREPLIGQDA